MIPEKEEKNLQEEMKNTQETPEEKREREEETALVSQIRDLEDKVREYEDLVRRKVADFENFRKRAKQEKESLGETLSEKLILDFLPVYDNFERALKAAEKNKDFDSLLEGIQGIYHIFSGILEKNKIQKVDSAGQPYDPRLHEALYIVEGDYEKPVVLEEVEKAFIRGEKVIRIARVSVGMPKKKPENAEDQGEKTQ